MAAVALTLGVADAGHKWALVRMIGRLLGAIRGWLVGQRWCALAVLAVEVVALAVCSA